VTKAVWRPFPAPNQQHYFFVLLHRLDDLDRTGEQHSTELVCSFRVETH